MGNLVIRGLDMVCLGSERWGYPGFQQTIMRLFAKTNRVLFVNPIGTRKASFDPEHFHFYLRKMRNIFSGTSHDHHEDVRLCNPFIIPFVYSTVAQRINRRLFDRQIRRVLETEGFKDYLLWVGTPTAFFALDSFRPRLTIYNPVDRYYAFPFVDSEKIRNYERQVAARSDLVVCTSNAIKQDMEPYNRNVHVVSHGVQFDHFAGAAEIPDPPKDLAGIASPVIGYFGGLHSWVDFDLIYAVAIRYPNANLVLVGPNTEDLTRLLNLPNVHWLGAKPFAQIPLYLKHFDVCLIPFLVNDLIVGVDPTKLREYLTMGKPVVSVDLPEIRRLEKYVYIATDEESFVQQVGVALDENNPDLQAERIELARNSDWSVRAGQLSRLIKDCLGSITEKRCSCRGTVCQ